MTSLILTLTLSGALALQDPPQEPGGSKLGVTRRVVAQNGEAVELRVPISDGQKGLVTVVALPVPAVIHASDFTDASVELDAPWADRYFCPSLQATCNGVGNEA